MDRLRIPFVGPAYETRSPDQSAQRLVNWYIEKTEQGGKTPYTMYPTPGLVLKTTVGQGPIRAALQINDGYAYIVSGNEVYRLDGNYVATKTGSIQTAFGHVGIAYNGLQVIIVDGQAGYIVDVAANTLTSITDVDFPNGVTWAQYLDQYFVVGGDGSGRFYISSLDEGSTWNGTDYANAEGDPDPLLVGVVSHRELMLFGTNSFEVWINTGNSTFPLERSGNAFGEVGCGAVGSLCKVDNSVFWLGVDRRGDGQVLRLNGYDPVRISNYGIERAISGYSRIDDAIAFAYQKNGHTWYVLHFPTDDATWAYSVDSGFWHEWLSFDDIAGQFHRHRSNCHVLVGRDHVVGDFENGNLYALDEDTYTDNGAMIKRMRRTYAADANLANVFYGSLQLDMQTGVGLVTGQGSDPQMMLRWSSDGGHTWSNTHKRSIGKLGQYGARCIWNRLGAGRARVWEVSITDPVNVAIMGAVLLVEQAGA